MKMIQLIVIRPAVCLRSLSFLGSTLVFAFPIAPFFSKVDGAYIQGCIQPGMYTETSDNGTWRCMPCTTCPEGHRVSKPCQYHGDTVCERCPPETFVSESGQECSPCTKCQPGYYVADVCEGTRDRKCKPCADGYYSRNWNSLTCRRCKHCKRRENVAKPCNRTYNSICGDCEKDHYRQASTLECIPCSKCEEKHYVRVPECVRKLGNGSLYVCQPKLAVHPNNMAPTALEKQPTKNGSGLKTDILIVVIFTLVPVAVLVLLISMLAILLTFRCKYFLARLGQSRLKHDKLVQLSTYQDCETTHLTHPDFRPEKDASITVQYTCELADYANIKTTDALVAATSDKEEKFYPSTLPGIEICHTKDTACLLQNHGNTHRNDHRKKRKRKLKSKMGESDFNILQYNRFAPLEASKYTTI